MKAKPLKISDGGYDPCSAQEATHVLLNMPGPIPTVILPIHRKSDGSNGPGWSWDGDVDKPTLEPSLLSRCGDIVCHSFVRNGVVQFLSDCTHELRDQHVELLDVEDDGDE